MKKSSSVITRKVLETTLLLPMKASKDGLWAYEMNDVAAVLWDGIAPDSTPESLAAKLQEVFDVPNAEALADTNAFLEEMKAIGALE